MIHLEKLFRCTALAAIVLAWGLVELGPAMAQDEILSASRNRELGGRPLQIVSGPPSDGKETFFARGIQGEPTMEFVVGADGVMRQAAVVISSRSPELDEFALGLVRETVFRPARDKSGQPVTVRATFPIQLWKDSIVDGSIFKKRCDDFVIDADWFMRAFPEKEPDQMRSWQLLRGALFAARVTNKAAIPQSPDFQSVYTACQKRPSRKLIDVFSELES